MIALKEREFSSHELGSRHPVVSRSARWTLVDKVAGENTPR
jgi:hypothetical protein